ncbi:MAG: hypothetical protein Q7T57_08695 [Dehalococcoidales bacterium]|nr:hypothetical protein [Dehalococcoidales bacterium]
MELKGRSTNYQVAKLNTQRAYKKAQRRAWINHQKLLRSQGKIP